MYMTDMAILVWWYNFEKVPAVYSTRVWSQYASFELPPFHQSLACVQSHLYQHGSAFDVIYFSVRYHTFVEKSRNLPNLYFYLNTVKPALRIHLFCH